MATSFCWKYFDVNPKNKNTAVCKLCQAIISKGGKSAKTFTTTNMLNHLRKIHPKLQIRKGNTMNVQGQTFQEQVAATTSLQQNIKLLQNKY